MNVCDPSSTILISIGWGRGQSPNYIDQRNAAFGAYIDAGEIVKTFSCTFIDRETLRAIGFDDISERGERFPCPAGRETVQGRPGLALLGQLSEDAKPADPAIGIDIEAHMGNRTDAGDRVAVKCMDMVHLKLLFGH
jgi:hypothetical protein